MPSQAFTDLNEFQQAVDTETTRIAGEFQSILDSVEGGVTAAEAAALVQQGQNLIENLKAIGNGGAVVPEVQRP